MSAEPKQYDGTPQSTRRHQVKIRMATAALVAVAAALTAQAPASAVTTQLPTVGAWKLYPNDGRIAIQIQGGSDIWGLRKFAAEADRQIPELRIYLNGTCAQRPWATCVRVRTTYRPNEDWYGVARWQGKYQRLILLNNGRRKRSKYPVAAHEFTHALGLSHHRTNGVVGRTPNVVHLSAREVAALRRAY